MAAIRLLVRPIGLKMRMRTIRRLELWSLRSAGNNVGIDESYYWGPKRNKQEAAQQTACFWVGKHQLAMIHAA